MTFRRRGAAASVTGLKFSISCSICINPLGLVWHEAPFLDAYVEPDRPFLCRPQIEFTAQPMG